MSLVAYEPSSDEESDTDDIDIKDEKKEIGKKSLNGFDLISDDEDEINLPPISFDTNIEVFLPTITLFKNLKEFTINKLPESKVDEEKEKNLTPILFETNMEMFIPTSHINTLPVLKGDEEEECNLPPISFATNIEEFIPTTSQFENLKEFMLSKLPAPKTENEKIAIQEEVDEFLYKKAIASEDVKLPRSAVKITIPAMSTFKTLDEENENGTLLMKPFNNANSSFGLLNLLPKPKIESNTSMRMPGNFLKQVTATTTSFIPNSVLNRKAETVPKPLIPEVDDDSDSDDGISFNDFFALNEDKTLPEISSNEIDRLIDRRMETIIEAKKQYKLDKMLREKEENDKKSEKPENTEEEEHPVFKNFPLPFSNVEFDEKAIHALAGSQAKRRKTIVEIKEISSAEILPDREEWLRTALTSETSYQAKGVLVDEEPAAGTRKKHQITYLAHQARSNEAELQAIWATNRQNRRAAATKYGF